MAVTPSLDGVPFSDVTLHSSLKGSVFKSITGIYKENGTSDRKPDDLLQRANHMLIKTLMYSVHRFTYF